MSFRYQKDSQNVLKNINQQKYQSEFGTKLDRNTKLQK